MRQIPGVVGWRDHLLGLALAVSYVALLLPTSRDLAMSRDESFYVVAAERYGAWFEQAWDDVGAATEQSAIDAAWGYNHEHPSLVKSAFALSNLIQERFEPFPTPGMAIRFPGMVSAGLLLWLIYIFGARLFGRSVGAFAAMTMALLPRVFYHAHLGAFDVPITLMLTLVTYCYWRSLSERRWAIWLGIAFGLALATKHNTWMMPAVLLVHWLWVAWGEVRARRLGEGRRLSLVPWWLLAMALLGPPVFVGSWPWLWNDTWSRIGEYVGFHMNHEYYNMAYFGVNHFWPPFPVSFPWVMTAYTVPLVTLALAACGLYVRAWSLLPPGLEAKWAPPGRPPVDRFRAEVLLVGCLLAPLVAISLPSSPIFGGTKHWFPAYPFLALFAGLGFRRVLRVALRVVRKRVPVPRAAMRAAVAAILLLPNVAQTVHAHPFGLSYYGFVAGGVPGAADDGMNRQFWGFTQGSLAGWLRERMPQGGTVWICDATFQAWEMMQRDGMIPENIRATPNMATADYVIVHHEHHFDEVDFQAWVAFGSVAPVHVLTYDGVPIISVYSRDR